MAADVIKNTPEECRKTWVRQNGLKRFRRATGPARKCAGPVAACRDVSWPGPRRSASGEPGG